jgi:glycine cleavage system regulatory protein
MPALILTLIGPDRPGLVSALSERVAAHGGNWLESRLAHLAGQFAGIALVDVPEEAEAALRASVSELAAEGLRVTVEPAGASAPPRRSVQVKLVAHDRAGIVRDVSAALAARGANIEEMATHVVSGSFSGETMFHATVWLKLPEGADPADLRGALERLGNELMVDIIADGKQE